MNPIPMSECKKIIGGIACQHYSKESDRGLQDHAGLEPNGDCYGWDIEDLASLGRQRRQCPYYGSRRMLRDAWLVFCPYNYVINPHIRKTMESLAPIDNAVIIIDEAHNIEDTCRQCADVEITESSLQKMQEGITKYLDPKSGNNFEHKDELQRLSVLASCIVMWMNESLSHQRPHVHDRGTLKKQKHWQDADIVREISTMIGVRDHAELQSLYADYDAVRGEIYDIKIQNELKSKDTSDDDDIHSPPDVYALGGYFSRVNDILQDENDDYIVMIDSKCNRAMFEAAKRGDTNAKDNLKWSTTLSFRCMNAAVTFNTLKRARSIILTSGTLSPMDSFSSELGTEFKVIFEGKHVIDPSKHVCRVYRCHN